MNLRKFYLIISVIVSAFLFTAGIAILYYLNSEFIKTSGQADAGDSLNGILQPFVQSKEPFNILVLGGDKVSNNSDTMMLVNFDPSTCKANIMSIPRDTKVMIEDQERKINYAYPHAGVELAAKTVSELLDVKIKYYVFVDTKAFRNIIDLLGGVRINIPADMNYDDPTQDLHIHLKKGLQTLNGDQAEQYVRFRHPSRWTKDIKEYYDGSDLKRIEAQQEFIKALVDQKLSLQYLPKLNSIIDVLFENIDTNFTLSELMKLTGFAGRFKMENLNFISMPGTTYDGSPWYYLCDVEKAREITSEYFKCDESFTGIDENAGKAYDNSYSKSSKPAKKDTKKSTSKNNPSNADSSIKGQQAPEP